MLLDVHADQSTANLKALLNNTDDLMWSVDRNFKLLSSNQAFDRKVIQLSGKKMRKGSDVLATGLKYILKYERALAGETFTEVDYLEMPVEVWFEVSFYPIRRGNNISGITCYARDISIHKKEEIRLKLLESVVTHATDAVLITEVSQFDESGPRIVYVNDALIAMTGYSREEMIGKTPKLFYGINSDKVELTKMADCFTNSSPCEIEVVYYKKNGEEFWINLSLAPVSDSIGSLTHFIAIGRDVTERIKNIEAINEQNKKLRDIAWIQSHEVRGPLARIKGLINLLQHEYAINPTEKITHLITLLNVSTDELDVVIQEITKRTEDIPRFNVSEDPLAEEENHQA